MGKKPYRFISWCILILWAFAISVGCRQAPSQAEEKNIGKSSLTESSKSGKKRGNMSEMFKGKVVEAIDAGRYAFVQIDSGEKRLWVAVQNFDSKPGDVVIVPPGDPIADFYSKKLNRKFEMIYFVGSLRRVDENAAESPSQKLPKDHPPIGRSTQQQMTHPSMDFSSGKQIDVDKMEKAKGGQTVSEIITGRSQLAGKGIIVRAKVVKFTPNIMDKNWLHVRDGSGDENTNDLIVTTKAMVKTGDVVLIKGIVSVDRDFGFGLKYRVLIEDAEITVEE